MAWHPAEADTSAFVAQCPEEIHDLANERVVSIFAFNCLQARHWVREDYDIVLYRIHVPIIVQCQCDCCCLSSKDGTVIWESFGQLAASRLTILQLAVDDRCCPHSLVNLRSVSVDFIMWSLSIVILFEFGLSLFSCDNTAGYARFDCSIYNALILPCVFLCQLLWQFRFRFVAVLVCGLSGLWPFWFVTFSKCGRFVLWPFRFVAVSVCGRFGCCRFDLWSLWPVTIK